MILPFHNNIGVLEIIIEKIKENFPNIPVVIATTTNPIDYEIVTICKKAKINFFRGSESNVLDRFINASKNFGFSKIIRICADNPFIDIKALKKLYSVIDQEDHLDYCSFQTSEGTPSILTHYGLWGEAVTQDALIKTKNLTVNKFYLEHVTNFIYTNSDIFTIKFLPIDSRIEEFEDIRMTLDTKEDFLLLKEIYHEVNKKGILSVNDLLEFVAGNDDWRKRMYSQIKLNTK